MWKSASGKWTTDSDSGTYGTLLGSEVSLTKNLYEQNWRGIVDCFF